MGSVKQKEILYNFSLNDYQIDLLENAIDLMISSKELSKKQVKTLLFIQSKIAHRGIKN